jgi:hypothetical protein
MGNCLNCKQEVLQISEKMPHAEEPPVRVAIVAEALHFARLELFGQQKSVVQKLPASQ